MNKMSIKGKVKKITEIEDKVIKEDHLLEKGKNEFEFTLPTVKKSITFKILTHGDEIKIDTELKGL